MDCLKYKIQLSEKNNKNRLFPKTNLQTNQFKDLRAQASEADYYIVYIYLTGTPPRAAEPSGVKAWPRQTQAAATPAFI